MAKRAAREEEDEGISKLPEEIIQHILCNFLTPEEAAQARLLSKAWLNAWQTCPVLRFDQKNRKHMFLNCVNKVLLNYHEKNNAINTFKLRMDIGDHSSDHGFVDEWIKIAAGNGLKTLDLFMFGTYTLPHTVLETKSLENLLLTGCDFDERLMGDIMCDNLRQLVLNSVLLKDKILGKIIASCRLIENLDISLCGYLRNIHLNNLPKLKQFSIKLHQSQSVEIDAPNLESFTCEAYEIPRKLPFVASQNLKRLSFFCIGITDSFFDDLRIKFPNIENLRIIDCGLLNSIKISSQSLKILEFRFNKELKELQVDAPKIGRFEYEGYGIPRLVFSTSPSNWESSIILVDFLFGSSDHYKIDNSWFIRLKEMLTSLIRSRIHLEIWCPNKVTFNLDEIEDGDVAPRPEVETLYITEPPSTRKNARVASALADGCFWSCRPKVIQQIWYNGAINQFAVVFHRMLLERQNHSIDLKDVEVEILKWTRGQLHDPEIKDWKCLSKVKSYDDSVERVIAFKLEYW